MKSGGGYQFAHIEAYGRKGGTLVRKKGTKISTEKVRSMSNIIDEAMRRDGAHPHVPIPKPPILLFGVMPDQAAKNAEAWAAQAKDAMGRKLRIDGHCIVAGVVSLPADRVADWPAYRSAAIEHLKTEYGDALQSVVEHTDEANPHFHFYAVPRPGQDFASIHAGYAAQNEAKKAGKKKTEQMNAFKKAMREWQDRFHKAVGLTFGLARIGPKKRRLSREEWKAEQAAAAILAKNIENKPIVTSKSFFNEKIDAIEVKHRSGLLSGGEALYTREQLTKACVDFWVLARDEQYNKKINLFDKAFSALTDADVTAKKIASLEADKRSLEKDLSKLSLEYGKTKDALLTEKDRNRRLSELVNELEEQIQKNENDGPSIF